MELRRVGALSLARIIGAIYALLGLVAGAIISLIALVAGTVAQDQPGGALAAMFGVSAVIVVPVFYGAAGFIGSLIVAGLYNWLAGMLGGVRLEMQAVTPVDGTATG